MPDSAAVFAAPDAVDVCATPVDLAPVIEVDPDAPLLAALRVDLEQCTTSLTKDPAEAARLVEITLARIVEDLRTGEPAPEGRVALFRMLRQAYHSVERTRIRRAARPQSTDVTAVVRDGSDMGTDTAAAALAENG